jgi:hypothetical protein
MRWLIFFLLCGPALAAPIHEERFHSILEKLSTLYASDAAAMGQRFEIKALWENPQVNAFADKRESLWTITVYGGLARDPWMTEDAFTLIACHELGHLFGGLPEVTNWAGLTYSSEGQADYYAAECFRRFHLDEKPSALEATDFVKLACETAWNSEKDRVICERAALAAVSVGLVFYARSPWGQRPALETPDLSQRPRVNLMGYPALQCRVDTLFQGALLGPRPKCWFSTL